jgi:heat shock protein HtpX
MDWREQLRKNAARTRWVIVIFILLFLCVGLLIDVALNYTGISGVASNAFHPYAGSYSPFVAYHPSIWQCFVALITLQVIPYVTIVMVGIAIISLLITYRLYDKLMLLGTSYTQITESDADPQAKQLYNVVEEMKVAAGMRYTPKVFIIDADYMNAFASGYSEKSAMVAITRGLLEKLNRAELQAVMAHELSHIRHGDIKLTLTASVLSNIMLMAMDFLFYRFLFSRDNEGRANALILVVMIARFVLPLITVLLMLYLSRTREYMADAGSVELMRDNGPLISALRKIHEDHQDNAGQYSRSYDRTAHESIRRASYIYDPILMGVCNKHGPSDWFSTHPGLDKRLAALGLIKTL